MTLPAKLPTGRVANIDNRFRRVKNGVLIEITVISDVAIWQATKIGPPFGMAVFRQGEFMLAAGLTDLHLLGFRHIGN